VSRPRVSVVVPTHNRHERLAATLAAVLGQEGREETEVLVVDDGSDDETPRVVAALAGSGVSYLHQPHGGASAARNRGARAAHGALLLFVDDDVELLPDAVAALVEAHRAFPHAVVVGHLFSPEPANRYEWLGVLPDRETAAGINPVDCTECLTGLLAVGREQFLALDGFEDPTGGWPSWDDVDFGYRAQRAGLQLLRTSEAQGIHHDESATSLAATARRWQAASESAVRLFARHPDLRGAFPFYRDKLPIAWGSDPATLVARKLARGAVSSRPALRVTRPLADLSVRGSWPGGIARPLCGCVVSGSMWQGLRRGIEASGREGRDSGGVS